MVPVDPPIVKSKTAVNGLNTLIPEGLVKELFMTTTGISLFEFICKLDVNFAFPENHHPNQ